MSGPSAPGLFARGADWRRARLAALDFETTGLDVVRDHVISYGIVPIEGGRIRLSESVYGLARPAAAPSPVSVTVHGLRAQDLEEAPDQQVASDALRASLEGRFLVTWYAGIENAFLDRFFPSRRGSDGWAARNVDVRGLTLDESSRPTDERSTLTAAAKRYGVPVADPHNALDDALVTAQLFLVLATRFASRGRGRIRDLLRAGRTTSVHAAPS